MVCRLEVSIVGNLSASDPPDSFDRIEFRRVGGQEDADEAVTIAEEEVLQVPRPVPGGVVQDEEELALGALEEMTEEVDKGCGVECGGLLGEKAARLQVERAEIADLLAGGRREDTGLLSLRGPHSCQGAVSLEVDFVLAPELSIGVLHPLLEVFLKTFCWRGEAS